MWTNRQLLTGSFVALFLTSLVSQLVFLGDRTLFAFLWLSVKAILIIASLYLVLWFLVKKSFGPEKAASALINISVFLIAGALVGIAAEVALRSIFHDVTTTTDNRSYFSEKWKKTIYKNALGFRDKDFEIPKRSGVYRIAAIGDSLTYGQGINVEDRFTNILQRRLSELDRTRSYEVLNFGRPGAETVDHLHVLEDIVLRTQPDFILLQWYINDVRSPDEGEASGSLTLIPVQLRKKSVLFYLLHRQVSAIQGALGGVENDDDYMLTRFRDKGSPSWVKAAKTLQTFVDLCKKAKISLGLVLFSDSYFRPESKLDFLLTRVLESCVENGLICSDTRHVFAPYQGKSELWASKLDPHPSAFANRLVVDQLMQTFGNIWLAR